jgi:hypothetical protein
MRHWSELKGLHERWSADVLSQIKNIPNEVDRLRLLIEARKSVCCRRLHRASLSTTTVSSQV